MPGFGEARGRSYRRLSARLTGACDSPRHPRATPLALSLEVQAPISGLPEMGIIECSSRLKPT
jgi:hypothetical protein